MKKVSLLLISFMLTFLPSMAKTTVPEKVNEDAPKVFIYHIPDDVVKEDTNVSSSDKKDEKVSDDIVSDDITADTSGVVTTIALSAPAIAFLNPCSIPAGQSSRI